MTRMERGGRNGRRGRGEGNDKKGGGSIVDTDADK